MAWWKDIDIQLRKKHNGDISDFINEFAIMESLKNIFKTVQGQRRRLPEFALNLYNLLFEPLDQTTAREIGNLMLAVIERWETRVVVTDLLIKPNYYRNRYDVKLTFYIRGVASPEPFTLEDTIQAS